MATSIVEELRPFDGEPFFASLVDPWRSKVRWFRQSASDLLVVMQLYLAGFNHVKAGNGPVIEYVRAWVDGADGKKSMALQFGIFASGLCALLEATLPDMFEAFFRESDVARVHMLKRDVEPDPAEARSQFARWVNPTGKGDVKWASRVADVFDFSLGEGAQQALATLLTVRHGYTHDREKALTREPTADEMTAWLFASYLVVSQAARSVSQRAAASGPP